MSSKVARADAGKESFGTVLVAGSANVDFVARASHVPRPGETVLGRDFAIFPGGKGANQAVACARAGGVPTRMVLALGEDVFAPLIEGSLRDAGVELHVVRVAAAATGAALICVADDAQNAITVAPGANSLLRTVDQRDLAGVGYLLLQLETPLETVIDIARAAHAAGVKVVLNAAPARPLPDELLDVIDVLIVNEDELTRVTGHGGSIAQRLESVRVPLVIVTLGQRGCCARHGREFFLQPSFRVKSVDTTSAGDTFCGVLGASLCSKVTLAQALRRASAAAALATTRIGAQSSIPTYDEVEALMHSNGGSRGNNDTSALATYCQLADYYGTQALQCALSNQAPSGESA
ncbi:MAG: ribokinase [Steroidobacteraceae bacterium]